MLRIRLLGDFDVRHGAERLATLRSPRVQSLLAYLLVHRDAPQPRQRLAFLLWPDSTEAQARTNLRQLLHHLRRGMPDADRYLEISTTIRMRADASMWVDVVAFERLADQAAGGRATVDDLIEAVGLYRGDLLPSCYDDWILDERTRLRGRVIEILELLVGRFEERGDFAAAIRHAEQLLRWDPLNEATHRRLMRLHSRVGQRARALRAYHICASTLEREVGVAPDPSTRAAYEALVSASATPVPAAHAGTAPPRSGLVGRRDEWERVVDAWREAAAGHALMLAVTGEAGIGKSRVVEELAAWCDRQGVATARTRAYAAAGRLAYTPVAEWLRSDALRPGLVTLEQVWRDELSRLLPELGSPQQGRTGPLTEGERRRRLFEALARAVLAVDRPLLLVVDDLQWCDQETLEFVHYLLRFRADARLLVAGTARDDEAGPHHPLTAVLTGLRSVERLREIALDPLGPEDALVLAERLHQGPIASELAQRLYREAEGNPLFLVESIRAWQSGHTTADRARTGGGAGALAPRVRSIIESRLAQLSPTARDLVSVAATVGREFTYEVLAACGGLSEDELVHGLDELWQRRIIREHPGASYDFTHDKIREVAYAWVGPARRRQLHLAVAEALRADRSGDPSSVAGQIAAHVAGQIAAHYDRAGVAEHAIRYYRRAAEAAQHLWASEEVIALLSRALELLRTLPETLQRDGEELAILIGLSVALVARRGHGSREATDAYRRARELCDRLGRPLDPPLLRGLALAAIVRREFDEAAAIGLTLLRRGDDENDGTLVVEGRYVLGVTMFWRGEFGGAREHLQDAINRYEPRDHPVHVALFAQDPKAVCLSRLALTLAYLGRPATAVAMCDEALTLARQLAHPFTLGYVLLFAAWLHSEVGDLARMAEFTAAAGAVNAGQEMAGEFDTMVRIFDGWIAVAHGDPERGVARIREGLRAFRERERVALETYGLALLARSQVADDAPGAERTILEALELTTSSGQRYLESELLRLRGELLVPRDPAAARSAFRRALEVAHGQQSLLLELRAAACLASLPGGAEERRAARHMLANVYARFDEGHDTPDLRKAKSLLDEDGRESERR